MAEETIKKIEVKISWDGKQMKVGIPAEFVEKFQIDSKTDKIEWIMFGEREISLIGRLIKNAKKEN